MRCGQGPWFSSVRAIVGHGRLGLGLVVLGAGSGTAIGQSSCLPFGPTGFSPPGQARAIAQGDLNGDGHPDLVTTHFFVGSNVFVYLSNGAGGFAPGVGYASGSQPNEVAVGDMDLDGDLDIVVTTNFPGGESIIVRLNDGAGGFSAPPIVTTLPASSTPTGLLLSDLDLDNDLDVVIAKSQSFSISVLMNVGGPSMLSPPVPYTVPAEVRAIAKADFDGDGDDDVVITGINGVVVMRNNDAGAFVSVMANLPSVRGGEAIAAGDIDNDNDIDIAFHRTDPGFQGVAFWLNTGPGNVYTPGPFLPTTSAVRIIRLFRDSPPLLPDPSRIGPPIRLAIAEQSRERIDVYDGDGVGGFSAPRAYAVGSSPSPGFAPFLAADLDDDGFVDLAYAKSEIGGVLRGNFTGRFGIAESVRSTANSPTADLALLTDNDDQIDLIVANEESDSLFLFRGQSGVFTQVDTMPIGDGPAFVRASDLEGDGGQADLVVAVRNQSVMATLKNTISNGFLGPIYSDCPVAPTRFEMFNLDGNEQPDVAVIGFPENRIVFMGSDGTEFFAEQTSDFGPGVRITSLTAGDVDQDGDDDVIVSLFSGVFVLFRNEDGVMSQTPLPPENLFVESIILSDVDIDGDLDLVLGRRGLDLLFVRNLGGGIFDITTSGVTGNFFGAGVLAADVSGDGRDDLVTFSNGAVSQIAINIAPPSGPIVGGALQYPLADQPSALLAADLDNDGDADLVSVSRDARTVTVLRSLGGCPDRCLPDLAAPFGTLNFFDVVAYIAIYNSASPAADLAPPFGTLNFFDLSAYIATYNAGCP